MPGTSYPGAKDNTGSGRKILATEIPNHNQAEEEAMTTKRSALLFLILAVFMTLSFLQVFAESQPIKIDNIKSLTGTWRGHAYDPVTNTRYNDSITIHIKGDGTYKAYGQMMVVGALSLSDDKKIYFKSSRARGTVTFHEENVTQILRFWFDNGDIAGEYERIK